MKGFVIERRGRYYIDRIQRFDSLIIDEIILRELEWFLINHYSIGGSGHLLDLGAGLRSYLPVYNRFFVDTTAIDFKQVPELPGIIDVYASAEHLPFQDNSFDCIICTEVLEHLPNPIQALRECQRVLKPGGYLFLTTPFLHPLHELPYDYFRYTPYAYKSMGDDAGLQLEYASEKGGIGAFLLLLVLHMLYLGGVKINELLRWPLLTRTNLLVYLFFIWPQLFWLYGWTSAPKSKRSIGKMVFSRLSLGYVGVFKCSV